MSANTLWSLARIGLPGRPALPDASFTEGDKAMQIGLYFGFDYAAPAVVVPSLGYLELRDAVCGSVGISDWLAHVLEVRDAAAGTVGVSDG